MVKTSWVPESFPEVKVAPAWLGVRQVLVAARARRLRLNR
jgi:hypothetical protein